MCFVLCFELLGGKKKCHRFWDMESTVGCYTVDAQERSLVMDLMLVAWSMTLVFNLRTVSFSLLLLLLPHLFLYFLCFLKKLEKNFFLFLFLNQVNYKHVENIWIFYIYIHKYRWVGGWMDHGWERNVIYIYIYILS